MAKKVMLDAGHGGVNLDTQGNKEPGIVTNGYYECALTLITANKVREYLTTTYDVEVYMTRTSDTYVPLGDRGKMAKDLGVDLFVSIHYNGFNSEAFGYEDYVHTNANVNNIAIQKVIHDEIVKYTSMNGIANRGSKKEDFQVLRDTYQSLPSILIEGLFLDNANDVSKLNDLRYLEGYCKSVANAIALALNLPKLTEQTSDFAVEVNGLLVGQYSTINGATDKVVQLYNAGGTTDFRIVAKKSATPPPSAIKTKVVDFVGKANGDGDKTRAIWFTSNYSTDQPPENVMTEVNSGYKGVSVIDDGQALGLEVTGAVGKQIQFEFTFDLSFLGENREDIANKLSKLTFKSKAGTSLDYNIKVLNPISNTYSTLGTYSGGETFEVVNSDFLNVRKTPEATGELVGKLYLGNRIKVLSIDSYGWACIKFNGGMAYCSTTYLKRIDGNSNNSFVKPTLTYALTSDLLQYVSSTGKLRFGIMSVDKSVGAIPLYIGVDYCDLTIEYRE